MIEELFSNFEDLKSENGTSMYTHLYFLEGNGRIPKVGRIGKPVLFLFPVPIEFNSSKIESDAFYTKTACSLAALRSRINSFGIAYMVTGRGTVNYVTLPEFNSAIGGITEHISALKNSGLLYSLGVRGDENMMIGVDPFIAYEGDSMVGEVIVKGDPNDNRTGRKIGSWISRLVLKDYDTETDIWPLPQPALATSFTNSILDSAAEVQKSIANGLEGRIHITFNFRPAVMQIYKGVSEIEKKIKPPPPLFSLSSTQGKQIANNLSKQEEESLRKIKNNQFRNYRAKSAYQVEVEIFAIFPRNEPEEKWRNFVDTIAEKGSRFYEGGMPFNNDPTIPRGKFSKVDLSLAGRENRNPLYLYLNSDFFKGKPGERKLNRVEPNRTVSVEEAGRMFAVPSQEMLSDLRIIMDRGRINTLPALQWLHERVFGTKPDAETMIDGYGDRDSDDDSWEERRNE